MALPSLLTQSGIDCLGVITALTAKDHITTGEHFKIIGIVQTSLCFCYLLTVNQRGLTTRITGAKEYGFNMSKIVFVLHALHQDAAHHAAPTNETNYRIYERSVCHKNMYLSINQ